MISQHDGRTIRGVGADELNPYRRSSSVADIVGDVVAEGEARSHLLADRQPNALRVGTDRYGDTGGVPDGQDSQGSAFRVKVIGENIDPFEGRADASFDDVIGSKRWLIARKFVDDDHHDRRGNRLALAVGDPVAEGGSRRGVRGDGHPEAVDARLVDRFAHDQSGRRLPVDDPDDVAVEVAIVAQRIDEASLPDRNDHVIAHRNGRGVAIGGRNVDADPSLFAFATADRRISHRVGKDIGAGPIRLEGELTIWGDRGADRCTGRLDQLGSASDDQRVPVGIAVVGQQIDDDRNADDGRREVVAGIGFLVGAAVTNLDTQYPGRLGSEVVGDAVGDLDPTRVGRRIRGEGCTCPFGAHRRVPEGASIHTSASASPSGS